MFRTSLEDKKTRFVWLQKFAETKLPKSSPDWEYQEHVTIEMPEENDLSTNSQKFLKIVHEQTRHRMALEFLKIESELALHVPQVINGETGVAFYCSSEAVKLLQLMDFIRGDHFDADSCADRLERLYDVFDVIGMTKNITDEQVIKVQDGMEALSTVKLFYLSERDIHRFVSEEGGVIYY